jgi:hypothetical protein
MHVYEDVCMLACASVLLLGPGVAALSATLLPCLTTNDGAFMEPRVATGGKRSQIAQALKAGTQAETVAVGCD